MLAAWKAALQFEQPEMAVPLEDELQGDLHLARAGCAVGAGDGGEGLAEGAVLELVVGVVELRVVEKVVDLQAELQLELFGDGGVFQGSGIYVDVVGAVEGVLADVGSDVEWSEF